MLVFSTIGGLGLEEVIRLHLATVTGQEAATVMKVITMKEITTTMQ